MSLTYEPSLEALHIPKLSTLDQGGEWRAELLGGWGWAGGGGAGCMGGVAATRVCSRSLGLEQIVLFSKIH